MSFIQERCPITDIEKFIKLIKVHTCLWNTQSCDYKDSEARENAFIEIGIEIGVSQEEVRKKYKILRTQYVRELRNSKLPGYLSRWRHFNALRFLSEEQDSPNKLWDPLNLEDTKEELDRLHGTKQEVYNTDSDQEKDFAEEILDGGNDDTEELREVVVNQANVDNVLFERTQSPQYTPPVQKKRPINAESKAYHEPSGSKRRAVVLMKAPKKLHDEYTIFGEHVANELRILKNQKHLQNSLKCTILQAIIDVNKAAHGGL